MVEGDECQPIGLGSSFIPDQHTIVLPRVSSHTRPLDLALNQSASNTFSFAKTHFCMTFPYTMEGFIDNLKPAEPTGPEALAKERSQSTLLVQQLTPNRPTQRFRMD